MLREATAMNVRQNLGELLNEVQYRHDEIVITKAGKPVAAMIDIATFERMRRNNDGQFERLWAEFSKGFDDLSEDEAQDLANVVVREARTKIALEKAAIAAKTGLRSSAKPKP